MTQYIEITVKTTPLRAEHVSYLLMDKIGCTGTVTEEDGTVKAYLYNDENPDLSVLSQWQVSTKVVKDEDWAENWKKYWHPQKVAEKIVICPSWREYTPLGNEVIINLDPGSAFGTGAHPTTRLCIQALENIIPKLNGDLFMADVGTGSGILAITAARLGVKHITGVDNDPSVIPVAVENAEINNIKDKCEFFTGSACDITGQFDIVVSNILAEIIIEIMDDLKKILKPGGVIILSGIIDKKRSDVEKTLSESGLKIQEINTENGWIAIIVVNQPVLQPLP